MYVAIGLIVAYIPRLFYLGKLCGYVCCGGKVKDTSDDRQGCVIAMNALLISHIMTAVLAVVISAATGADFASVIPNILSAVVGVLVTLWWRMDIMKWVQNKKDLEAK